MRRLGELLHVRPGEGATVARLVAVMLLVWAGSAVGANGAESLFFARFGPENLPFMFLAVAPLTFAVTVGLGGLLSRAGRGRVLALLPAGLAALVLALRLVLLAGGRWVYPVLWLSMMVVWVVLGTGTWSLAGTVHDSRQSKRLFPLYGAAVILGGALGGLATTTLVAWLGAENLLLVWAAALAAGSAVAASLPGLAPRRTPRVAARRTRGPSALRRIREGFGYARRSALVWRMSIALVLLALLYNTLSFAFAGAVTARFPDPDRLAGFLGLFTGGTNAVALVLSLLVANRLFARLGVATAVFTFPVLYAAGFAVAAATLGFGVLAAFRFAQLAWMYGVWQTAWQALSGVVPPERRAQTRAFLDGGPMQAGVALSGALLLAARELLSSRQLFAVAALAALGAAAAAWGVRRSYRGALVETLREGWPEVFAPEDRPFGAVSTDRAAVDALEQGLHDPDPAVRRLSVDMLAALAEVAAPARFTGSLGDADPAVRAAAADALVASARMPEEVESALRPLLDDGDAGVRLRAAAGLERAVGDETARERLLALAGSVVAGERAAALGVLGELGQGRDLVLDGLDDGDALVRRAAASALPAFGEKAAAGPLLRALTDEDAGVRAAAADALVALGPAVAPRLLRALEDPRCEDVALGALVRLPAMELSALREYALRQRDRALHYHGLWQGLPPLEDPRAEALAAATRHRALTHAGRALRAQAGLSADPALEVALESLASRDPSQRANAIETLESVRDAGVARSLVAVWDPEPGRRPDGVAALRALLRDDDAWIRACAAFVAEVVGDGELREALARMAESDPDPTAREAARGALGGDGVETLPTRSLMERVVALRQVPLFRELSPEDLRHVAEQTVENAFPDGTLIAAQGDPGEALHVVLSGDVRVVLGRGGHSSEVARRGPGYVVGEMAVVSEEPRMASLVAVGDVRTLSLDRGRFQRILRERPDAALAVMRELSARLREASARGSSPA